MSVAITVPTDQTALKAHTNGAVTIPVVLTLEAKPYFGSANAREMLAQVRVQSRDTAITWGTAAVSVAPDVWANLPEAERTAFGERVYEELIRPVVEVRENIGKYLNLDIATGTYVFGRDSLLVITELLSQSAEGYVRPSRFRSYRIGHPVVSAERPSDRKPYPKWR